MQWPVVRWPIVLLALPILSGCGGDVLEPGPASPTLVLGDLEFRIDVEPDEVAPGESFLVTFEAENRSADTVTVTTPRGCLVLPRVYQGDQRMPFAGTGLTCPAMITTHTFEPGETTVRSWELEAELYATVSGEPDDVPAPPGHYRVRGELEFPVDGEPAAVEAGLTVQ